MTRLRTYLLLSLSVLAMGIALRSLKEERVRGAVKTVEDYWERTGLAPSALEDLVDDESCQSSQRYFLACVNSLSAVADRLDLKLEITGKIVRSQSGGAAFNERTLLEPWRKFFRENFSEASTLKFRRLWRTLVHDHIPPKRQAMMTGVALNGFLSVFRDPHTYVIPVDYYERVISKVNASSSALGVILGRTKDSYFLRKVVEGSPSSRAGLRRGDWILSVNGVDLKTVAPQRLTELLRSDVAESSRIEVRRGTRVFTVEVPRESVEIPSVTWRRLDGIRPVGLLTINKFARESCAVVKDALTEMNRLRLRGLLLDVRDNTGGQMDEAACIVSLFVGPDRPAFKVRYLDPGQESDTYYGREQQLWHGKLAILINSGTASASEILAGSLRDHGRAVLVGERTFGKGSFQEGEIWSRNSKVAFFQTKGFYYLPSGYSPQMRGIQPDIAVTFADSMSLREEDQYFSSLNPPTLSRVRPVPVFDLSSCLDVEEFGAEDPQVAKAQTALFCGAVASGGQRGSL